MSYSDILAATGVQEQGVSGGTLIVTTLVDGSGIARLATHTPTEAEAMIDKAHEAILAWRKVPAPRCGDPLIRKPSEKTPLTARAVRKI